MAPLLELRDAVAPVVEDRCAQDRVGALGFSALEERRVYQDRLLTCRDCSKEFVFTAGEQQFYASKGLQHEPRRCGDCRNNRRDGGGGGGGRAQRAMHDVIMAYETSQAKGACVSPAIFKLTANSYNPFAAFATSSGQGAAWLPWSADEACDPANASGHTKNCGDATGPRAGTARSKAIHVPGS